MKNLKMFVFAALFLFSAGFSTVSASMEVKRPEINQIQKYLSNVDYSDVLKSDMKLSITFMVNHQNQIIVVSTSHPELDNVVKATLNYKRLNMDELEYNVLYTLPVTIKI
jgi:nitrate reductase NapAB chaperone NapD